MKCLSKYEKRCERYMEWPAWNSFRCADAGGHCWQTFRLICFLKITEAFSVSPFSVSLCLDYHFSSILLSEFKDILFPRWWYPSIIYVARIGRLNYSVKSIANYYI